MLGVYIHATHAKTPNGGIYHLNFLPVFILPFHGAYREEENQGEEGKTVYLVVPLGIHTLLCSLSKQGV
jgi:hypothetical protein